MSIAIFLIFFSATVAVLALIGFSFNYQRNKQLYRLNLLHKNIDKVQRYNSSVHPTPFLPLSYIEKRFLRAGYLTTHSRAKAKLKYGILMSLIILFSAVAGATYGTILSTLVGSSIGCYLGLSIVALSLSIACSRERRKLLRELPLFLELLILLVESGLGLLTAVHEAVGRQDSTTNSTDPIRFIFSQVNYRAAKGIPLAQALEEVANETESRVLKHTLLHLDMSTTEGAAVVPSLRALADYTHTEWRHSVEARVRRLENWVVFPVVAAVVGLTIATAAVPILPVLDIANKLPSGAEVSLVSPNKDSELKEVSNEMVVIQ